MAYVDYTYYKDIMKGKIITDSDIFDDFAEQGSEHMDLYILQDATSPDESTTTALKKCNARLAEYLYKRDKVDNIQSKKMGTVSVTYRSVTSSENDKSIKEIIYRYLTHTDLLFGGI